LRFASLIAASAIDSTCITHAVFWADEEIVRFCDVAGGSHGLGSLRLPTREGEWEKVGKAALAGMLKEAEDVVNDRGVATIKRFIEKGGLEGGASVVVAANCLEEIFEVADKELEGLGMPILGRVAELMKGKLRGSEKYVRGVIEERYCSLLV